MLKDYLKEKEITTYALAKKTGVAYSTLNDIVNGKVEIANCKAGIVKAIADALGLSMDYIFSLCSGEVLTVKTSYGTDVEVRVRNKSYYVQFNYGGRPEEIRLCRVSEDSSYYIDDMARWEAESYIMERRMEEFS